MRSVFVFMTLLVSISCDDVASRKVYFPQKSCEIDHYGFWLTANRRATRIMQMGPYGFKFTPSAYDKKFTLKHNDNFTKIRKQNALDSKENVITFGVYNEKSGSGDLIPLTYKEKPKMYLTKIGGSEFALKAVQIQLPPNRYVPGTYTPVHVTITLLFEPESDDKTSDLGIRFNVYGAVEEGVNVNSDLENFLRDLAKDSDPRGHNITRDLSFLKSALQSGTQVQQPCFYDLSSSKLTVCLASCEYIDNQVLRDLFTKHHVRVSDAEPNTDILPVDDYKIDPKV